MKIQLESKWSSFKRTVRQIWSGYTTLLLSKFGKLDPKVEKLAAYRSIIIKNNCLCTKYYVDFLGIKLLPYCRHCGCILPSKVRCFECSCPKGKWNSVKIDK